MDISEAKDICKKLTNVNVAIWGAYGNDKLKLREKFRAMYRSVIDAGFLITRYKNDGVPMFRLRNNKHAEDIMICSNRPDNLNIKSDCTTRCISLCTGIDYMTIRNEQLANAHATYGMYTWRHDVVWEKSLVSRGFAKIKLHKHLSRATFIRLARSCPIKSGTIATVSSHHVAAIDMKNLKILDTWNSSGGRIKTLYVPDSSKVAYARWLISVGYPTTIP